LPYVNTIVSSLERHLTFYQQFLQFLFLCKVKFLRILGICAISRLCCAFSESGNCVPISRLCSRFTQFVACTIEPRSLLKFPPCVKVRNVCKELLQLCHHQHQACTQASRARDFLEDPRPVECPRSRLHQLGELSVSSHALTLLVHYVCKLLLCNCNLKIVQMYCTISGLAHSFQVLRRRSAISILLKFLDCTEHRHYKIDLLHKDLEKGCII